MNDLFSKALTAIPAYMSQVLGLLSGPKAFVLGKDLESTEAAAEAYAFLGVTMLVALLAQISLLPEQKDYLLSFASLAIQMAIGLMMASATLYLSWRIVRGVMSFRILFIVSCYISGVSTLIFTVFTLVGTGYLRLRDPDSATQVIQGTVAADWTHPGTAGYWSIVVAGMIVVYLWIFIAWGAYRVLSQSTRVRSGIAFAIFIILSPLVLFVQLLMQNNLMTAPDRHAVPTAHLPPDLIGSWSLSRASSIEGNPATEALTFEFRPSGEYSYFRTLNLKQGACLIMSEETNSGRASVAGEALTLASQAHKQKMRNSCIADSSETVLDLDRDAFRFEIWHAPAGWMLCLSGRGGEQCLTAGKGPAP